MFHERTFHDLFIRKEDFSLRPPQTSAGHPAASRGIGLPEQFHNCFPSVEDLRSVLGGQVEVSTCTGAAAKETSVTKGVSRGFTLDLERLVSEAWLILNPSYLLDLVLRLTAVVSKGTNTLRGCGALNREEDAIT